MIHPSDITPLTFIDYPNKAACIFWYNKCNLRCPYCYNPDLVLDNLHNQVDEWGFLQERKGFIDAVVLSGGEVTLNPDLIEICTKIKELGYLIKVDTNGTNPEVVDRLARASLLDFVAVDNKAPSYKMWKVNEELLFNKFKSTVKTLIKHEIPYEIRTTVHPDLFNERDILSMIRECSDLGYNSTYYLQWYFSEAPKTLGNMKAPTSRYNRVYLESNSPLKLGYRNFPEDIGK